MIQTLLFIIAFLAVVIVLMNLFQQSTRPSNPIRRPTNRPTNRGNWWNRWYYPPRTGGPSYPGPSPECTRDSQCGTGLVCAGGVCRSGGKPEQSGCSNNQDCGTGMDCKMVGNRRQCVRGGDGGEVSIM
jgi:hypothetical protein